MIPSRPLTDREAREVHFLYHSIIQLAVQLDMRPNEAQREHLTQLLLQAADDAEPDAPALFIRATINYLRASQ